MYDLPLNCGIFYERLSARTIKANINSQRHAPGNAEVCVLLIKFRCSCSYQISYLHTLGVAIFFLEIWIPLGGKFSYLVINSYAYLTVTGLPPDENSSS